MNLTENSCFRVFGLLLLISFCWSAGSCRKEPSLETNPDFSLTFSTDTLKFDTVFSSLSSTTKSFLVHNPSNKRIIISRIYVKDEGASFFRINVNGIASNTLKNIEIAPRDSIFIFVKVTIDPKNQNNPFEILDNVIFEYNGKTQDMCLSAWGQDAYYHLPDKILKIPYPSDRHPGQIDTQYIPYSLIDCQQALPNDKPHVVYGYWVVDTDNTLTIPSGTKIHFASDACLWVYEGGSLKVQGQRESPVIFQGMRLESSYANVAGQWSRIWLSAGSKDNEINYAIIKNATVGVWADTVVNQNPNLLIQNTIIQNMSAAAIWAQGSRIRGFNLVLANCQNTALGLTLGGSYEFYQCTFTNYWADNMSAPSSLYMNDYYLDASQQTQMRAFTKADFVNCIFYGRENSQLLFDLANKEVPPYRFDYCLLKQAGALNIAFQNCIQNKEPLFEDLQNLNFNIINPASPAIKAGSPAGASIAPFDINGIYRSGLPTLGAYEYVPKN